MDVEAQTAPDRDDAAASLAVFLDFDGTLVEIAERPEAVVVDPALGPTLTRLRDRLGGALALVSGRSIATLDGFLQPHRFDAAGLHGLEVRINGREAPCRPEDHPALRAALVRLQAAIPTMPGTLVEDKGCSIALHWRLAPEHGERARALVAELAATLGPDYRIQFGKAVGEILPARSGKGAAIERFLEEAPYRGRRPVFIGDDLTDENGFGVVNARGGVSIRIGDGPTQASRRLASPRALRAWLARWAEAGQPDWLHEDEAA